MKKLTIGLVGLWHSKNLGDPLLCRCTEELLLEKVSDVDIKRIDINYKYNEETGENDKSQNLRSIIAKGIFKKRNFMPKKMADIFQEICLKISGEEKLCNSYFTKNLKGVDAIIFCGGGLFKFNQQKIINLALYNAVKYAEQFNIPVAFHACGVEGFDEKDSGCKRLNYVINSRVTKIVTTRDDLETLLKYKQRKKVILKYAADSAIYSSEILNIKKDKYSNVIGLGIARVELFKEYGFNITREELLDFYIGMIKSLERRGEEWTLFTNGYYADYIFGMKILKSIGADESKMCIPPTTDEELVKQISKFSAVVAMRLHACIVSYSLNIPVIGLCWNNKVKQFGDNIGYKERFYYEEDFDAELIVKHVLKIRQEGYEQDYRNNYRKTSKESISEIVDLIIK